MLFVVADKVRLRCVHVVGADFAPCTSELSTPSGSCVPGKGSSCADAVVLTLRAYMPRTLDAACSIIVLLVLLGPSFYVFFIFFLLRVCLASREEVIVFTLLSLRQYLEEAVPFFFNPVLRRLVCFTAKRDGGFSLRLPLFELPVFFV